MTIAPLHKVKLAISIEAPDRLSPKGPESGIEFFFGIGREGLCPVERALSDKSAGDAISLPVEAGQLSMLFEHLTCHISPLLPIPPPFTMRLLVISADPADNREIVKAIANMGGCGGGCGCGCDG